MSGWIIWSLIFLGTVIGLRWWTNRSTKKSVLRPVNVISITKKSTGGKS